MSDPLVRFEGVSKRFGAVDAVREVSLDIAAGEFFALLGPSGCGKTTLMRLLAGFEAPDAGRILLDGKDVAALPPHRRPVHMMFQSYALFPHLTVARNVAFGLKGLDKAEAAVRVGEMLALLELEGLGGRKPDQLSGGQQQRVALARALAPRPRILLLDEPLAALDRKLREQTQLELTALQRRLGLTFMIVTHDQDEAMVVADRMAVMREGAIVQVGAPREIYERPVNRYVAGFIGEVNLFATGAQWVAVRPERLTLHETAVAGGLPGRISEIAYLGDRTRYVVATEIGQDVRVSLVGAPVHQLGDLVWVGQPRGGGVEVAE